MKKKEAEIKMKQVYEVNVLCAGNLVKDFTYDNFDSAKMIYNDLKDIIMIKSRLIIMDTVNESEYTIPTALCSIEIERIEYEEDFALRQIENTKPVKLLGN